MKIKMRWFVVLTLMGVSQIIGSNLYAKESSKGGDFGITLSPHLIQGIQGDFDALISHFFSLGIGVGGLKFTLPSSLYHSDFGSQPTVSILAFDVKARIHPFGGGFFLGAMAGRETFKITQSLMTKIETDIPGLNFPFGFDATATVSAPYVGVQMGWMYVFSSGFMWGFDLGWQFLPSPSTSVTLTPSTQFASALVSIFRGLGIYESIERDLSSQVQKEVTGFTSKGLPAVSIFRIGWFF